MPRGGKLHIETKMAEIGNEFRQAHGFGEQGMYAMISVADTGSGIDEAIQKKIFEPFLRRKRWAKEPASVFPLSMASSNSITAT
jgi:signal transduction histidine kinase